MANYSTLKAAVADVVKTNGTQAITGANLQAVLLSIINSVGGGGYIFKGVATPSTDAGTPDENVFYIGGAGTYANFGTNVTVPVGSICIFKYNGSWVKEQIALFAGIDDVPTAGSDNLVKSGGTADIFGARYSGQLKITTQYPNTTSIILYAGKRYTIYVQSDDASSATNAAGIFVYVNGTPTRIMSVNAAEYAAGKYCTYTPSADCELYFATLRANDIVNYSVYDYDISLRTLERKSEYIVDDNLAQYVRMMYIENEQAAKDDGIWLNELQYDYNVVYFKKADGTLLQVGTLETSLDGDYKYLLVNHATYGIIYIEVVLGSGAIKSYIQNNIGDAAFDIYPFTLRQQLNLSNWPQWVTTTLNQYIVCLYIENREAAITDNLRLTHIQYQYNAVYFTPSSGTLFNILLTAKDNGNLYGTINHATYGQMYVEIVAGTGNYTKITSTRNICERAFTKDKLEILNLMSSSRNLTGKKILAIGDSVTAGGQWCARVASITGATVSTHAKGGIHIINMVDGDGAGFAALTTSDVADKDYIIAMGFYNDRFDGDGGNEDDMYPTQNTFTGQLNYLVKKVHDLLIAADNRNCKIVIVSAHRYGKYPYINKTAYEDGDQLCAATKLVSDYNSAYFIDLMHNGNINKYNWDWFQSSDTVYNQSYIPADGINDGTNKPFASLSVAPSAASNTGKYITIENEDGCYLSNGTTWVSSYIPYIWNGDQLHPNNAGYNRIGDYIAGQLLTI